MNAVTETTKKTITAKVVSDKMEKTAVVIVQRKVKHQKYGRYITLSSKFQVHDPSNQCKIGDTVTIKESRPHSKNKMWELVAVVETNK